MAAAQAADARRRAELKKFKALTTGLLGIAALMFLSCEWALHHGHTEWWIQLVRAGSEAGMVGGLADWFAVTALFRKPMGLPIPHTNLVSEKKDQIGESLTEFVADNFLNTESIVEKVEAADVAGKLGEWLRAEDNAARVGAEAGDLVATVVTKVDPDEAATVIQKVLIEKLAEPEWAPPAGRLIGALHEEGYTDPVIEEIAQWLHKKALTAAPLIDRILAQRAPAWAPAVVNELIVNFAGDKVHRELVDWTAQVAADPQHEARRAVHDFLAKFSVSLQEDPALIARIEGLKSDIMGSSTVVAAPRLLWEKMAEFLIEEASNPESFLRLKIVQLAKGWGEKLSEDPLLRRKVNDRVIAVAGVLVDRYAGEITGIIGEKIAEWPAQDAAEKIEVLVGKDLQYIRINGTVVGALAGMGIFIISTLLFGS